MKTYLLATTMLIGLGLPMIASAQDAAPAAPTADDTTTVVVTGFRSSLQKSINLKKEAIVVRDSIVAEDIGKFPEANVAESLQRIPGVYLNRDGASNEGQSISIRGLGPEYNVTTLNGAPVHVTSSSNVGSSARTFNYDVFASELFGRVDFYKTPLAELEEGGIGGVVDLQTPHPFDGGGKQVLRYGASASYNTASEQVDPNLFALYSNTWGDWGFLIGAAHSTSVNMKSGFEATGGYNSNAIANQVAPAKTGPFAMTYDWADPRAAAMLGNRAAIDAAFLPRFYRYYGAENTRDRDGLVSSVQYKHDRLNVSLDMLYSHLTDSRDEFTFGLPIRNTKTTNTAAQPGAPTHNGLVPINVTIDPNGNLLEGTFGNTSYLGESYYYNDETKFGYASLNGSYQLTDSLKLTGQLSSSESVAFYDNKRIVSNIYGITTTIDWGDDHVYPGLSAPGVDFTDPNNFQDFSTALDWNREVDREHTAKLVADWDYSLGSWTGHLKAGISYVDTQKQKTKRNGTSLASAALTAVGTAGLRAAMLDHVPLDNLVIGDAYPQAWATFSRDYINKTLDPIGSAMASPVDQSTSFTADEAITTGFIQSDFTGQVLNRELRINAGVRYSQTDMTIDNYKKTGANNTYEPNEEKNTYDNILPSISAAYNLRDDLIWRASWGKTITRASLSLIAAQTVIPNIYNPYATSGNPDLKPAQAVNLDLSAEYYPDASSMVSITYFQKVIHDFIFTNGSSVSASTQEGTIEYSQPKNGQKATISGVELNLIKSFEGLGAPFDGFGVEFNVTSQNSEAETGLDYRKGRPIPFIQSPDLNYNAALTYQKYGFEAKLAYQYQGAYIEDLRDNAVDKWVQPNKSLDLHTRYNFSRQLAVDFDAQNILDGHRYYTTKGKSPSYQKDYMEPGRNFIVRLAYSY